MSQTECNYPLVNSPLHCWHEYEQMYTLTGEVGVVPTTLFTNMWWWKVTMSRPGGQLYPPSLLDRANRVWKNMAATSSSDQGNFTPSIFLFNFPFRRVCTDCWNDIFCQIWVILYKTAKAWNRTEEAPRTVSCHGWRPELVLTLFLKCIKIQLK